MEMIQKRKTAKLDPAHYGRVGVIYILKTKLACAGMSQKMMNTFVIQTVIYDANVIQII